MSDVDVAIEVVVAGANVVRRRFGTALDRIEKAAGDFATAADLEAETAMLAVLHRPRPATLFTAKNTDEAARWTAHGPG